MDNSLHFELRKMGFEKREERDKIVEVAHAYHYSVVDFARFIANENTKEMMNRAIALRNEFKHRRFLYTQIVWWANVFGSIAHQLDTWADEISDW